MASAGRRSASWAWPHRALPKKPASMRNDCSDPTPPHSRELVAWRQRLNTGAAPGQGAPQLEAAVLEEAMSFNRRADAIGGPRSRHPVADMAVADDLVKLIVGHFEEAFRLAIRIVAQPLLAQNRVVERDRQRRTFAAHGVAFER